MCKPIDATKIYKKLEATFEAPNASICLTLVNDKPMPIVVDITISQKNLLFKLYSFAHS